MRWEVEDKLHCEMWFFSGVNFAGTRSEVRIRPGCSVQGDIVDGREVKSLGLIAEPGIRAILMTSAAGGDDWNKVPWRLIQTLEGQTHTLQDGRRCVQVPDLDALDAFDANRTDAEFQSGFPLVERVEDGEGWTFGRIGSRPLKTHIRSIRIERIPGGPRDDGRVHDHATVVRRDDGSQTVTKRSAGQGVEVRELPSPGSPSSRKSKPGPAPGGSLK